jgi:uncharacterized membrane protein
MSHEYIAIAPFSGWRERLDLEGSWDVRKVFYFGAIAFVDT